MKKKNKFHQELESIMDEYVNKVYDYTKSFPKEEMFGLTPQLRRSALSVILNYIEGYARQSRNTFRHFLEISYGSLKESKYLVHFSQRRKYLSDKDCAELLRLSDRIGVMLWGVMSKLKPPEH